MRRSYRLGALSWLLVLTGSCSTHPDSTEGAEAPLPSASSPSAGTENPAPSLQDATAPKTRTETHQTAWTVETIHGLQLSIPQRLVSFSRPLDADPGYDEALQVLGNLVDQAASDPELPWALTHALLARGPEHTLPDGRLALDVLFEEHAERFDVEGQTWIRFPRRRGELRVQPHADLILKTVTEIGVSPERTFTIDGHPHDVGDLYRGTVISTWLEPHSNDSSYQGTDDMTWSLQALAAWAPADLRWVASQATPMALSDLATFSLAVLVTETQFLAKAMQAGADFRREGQGIFRYTCGGAHLLQGVGYAVARGLGGPRGVVAIQGQVAMQYYRLPRELKIYDQALQQHPEHQLRLLVQRLKFTGHFLESMTRLAALGFYEPTDAQLEALRGVAQQVVLVTRALEKLGVTQDPQQLRSQDEQLYLDLLGDSAHAVRGMELALGRSSLRL